MDYQDPCKEARRIVLTCRELLYGSSYQGSTARDNVDMSLFYRMLREGWRTVGAIGGLGCESLCSFVAALGKYYPLSHDDCPKGRW